MFGAMFCFVWRSRLLSTSVRSSEPLHIIRSAFRAIIITSQYRCPESSSSHSRFRRPEPPSHLRSAFRAITHQYQCSELSSSYFQFRRSEPSLISISVQSHPHCIFSFDVQSHHYRFSVSAFRAIITRQFDVQGRILGFGIQSHHCFSVRCSAPLHLCSAFSSITLSFRSLEPCFVPTRHSRPLPILASAFRVIFYFIWCSDPHFHLAFKATSSFSVQSHYLFLLLEFRVVVLVRHSESPGLSFTRRITIPLLSGVQSHWTCSFRPFESFIFLVLTFRATVLFDVCRPYHIFLLVWHSKPFFFRTLSCILSHHLS